MPISVMKVGRQRSLSGLAKAVFDLEGVSPAKIRNARELLLQANPHLADEDALKAGTSVVIPDEPGLAASPEREAIPIGREALVDLAASRASAVAAAVASASAQAKAEFARQRELLGDERLLEAFAAADPSLGREREQIREASDARAKAIDAEAALVGRAVQQLRRAIEKRS